MLAAYSMMVSISSLFALFIGMFIIYNSFAIAVTQRRSEIGILRALGATRAQIRWLFLGESAVTGLIGSIGGLVFGIADRARHCRVDRDADQRRVRRGAARRRSRRRSPALLAAALGDRHRDEHRRGDDSGAQCGARRSGAGAAEGQVSGAVGGREPAAGDRWRRSAAPCAIVCLAVGGSRVVFYTGYVMAIVAALLLSPMLSVALARAHAAGAEVAAAGRRRARGRQPDSVAAPHVGERRRADAVARARRGVRRDGARQLRLDHRLDGHGAQPRSVRLAVAEHRDSHDSVSRGRWRPSWRRCRASSACRRCETRGSCSGRRRSWSWPSMSRASRRPRGAQPVAGDADDMYRRTSAGRGADGVGQPRAASAPARSARCSRFRRRTASIRLPIVGHRRRLLRSAGHDPDGSKPVPAVLARRHGEHLPRVPEAGRADAGRAPAHSRTLRGRRARCSC